MRTATPKQPGSPAAPERCIRHLAAVRGGGPLPAWCCWDAAGRVPRAACGASGSALHRHAALGGPGGLGSLGSGRCGLGSWRCGLLPAAAAAVEDGELGDLVGEALNLLTGHLRRIDRDLAQRVLLLSFLRLVHNHAEARLRHRGRVDLLELLHAVLNELVCEAPIVQQRRRGDGVYPVLVPEQLKDRVVHAVFENLNRYLVVLLGVNSKVLDLVRWDGLVLGRPVLRRRVPLRVRPEGPDLDLACSASSDRVYDDGQERLLVALISHLRLHINPTQPATISRMRVVPSADVILYPYPLAVLCEGDHKLVGRGAGIDACLRALNGQREGVHDDEGAVRRHPAEHQAHHLVHLPQDTVAR
mmetsp:Transcript_84107/g.223267  ORF Transcript_84107/g.223267 Transcript_84107/m.223267 type:complete len:359 (+) Transcript_84107:163-1239(+)